MDKIVRYLVLICSILSCEGINFREQIEEYFEKREDSAENDENKTPSRRSLDLTHIGHILGSPSMASHLPEAEPILPGHTLIRPALGMLKSSVKFPHRELENGAGVYGGVNNLGIRYAGRNERILYSGFRRSPADYIMVAPVKTESPQSKFVVSSVVLDLDKDTNVYRQLLNNLKRTRNEKNKRIINIYTEPKSKRNRQDPSQQRTEYPLASIFVYGNSENASPEKQLQVGKKKALRVNFNYDDDDDDDLSLDDELPVQEVFDNYAKEVPKSEEKEKNNPKNKWFWNSKNAFSHVKIHQDAPDFTELMPANVTENIRNWWFYHQDDYQPFPTNTI